jgi:hypothetical protein
MAYNFIHRILNAKIPPPESAWEKIAAEMDKSKAITFPEKISAASIEPPSSLWDTISLALDKSGSSKKSVPVASLLKWTAAAVIAGLVILSATYFFSSQNDKQHIATTKMNSPVKSDSGVNKENQQQGSANSTINNSVSIASENVTEANNSKGKRAGKSRKSFLPVRYATIENTGTDNTIDQLKGSQANIRDNVSPEEAKYIPAPDYFVISAPNGERVRLSSKFSDAVASLMGGDNVDYNWKSKFDNWKTKLISNPSFIPAAGNFLDIAELKDLLKEQ